MNVWIPGVRLVEVLDQALVPNADFNETSLRKVNDLRAGRQEAISLHAADRILTDVGLPHWTSILEDECVSYTPSWVAKTREPRPKRRKYDTPEEALEANRERTRRNARRLAKRCKCGTPILDQSKTCHPCHVAAKPEPEHGTISRYVATKYRCRCDLCRAASSAYHRDLRRRQREAYRKLKAAA